MASVLTCPFVPVPVLCVVCSTEQRFAVFPADNGALQGFSVGFLKRQLFLDRSEITEIFIGIWDESGNFNQIILTDGRYT
jgi:hypothetical protein